jgi:hypothetical protein
LRSPATQKEEEESIGGLFAQLIDDAGTAVRAELNLYRTTALSHLVRARLAMIFAAVAVLLIQASVTALLVALAWGLARWLGPVGAGLAVAFAVRGPGDQRPSPARRDEALPGGRCRIHGQTG